MKIKIPTKIIEKIIESVELDYRFCNLTEKQSQKLFKKLIEIWYFIYYNQINDMDCNNLKYFTSISKNELDKFNLFINGIRLKHNDLFKILKDLIEINNSYSTGKFTKSYRINQDIDFGNLTECDIDFDIIFKNTLNKEYWINKYPNHKNLIEDCYNSIIDLDEYLFWMLSNKGLKLKPIFDKLTGKINERYLVEQSIYLYFNLALKVNLKNLWFKISNEGRFYSSISNLPTHSINFIKIDNTKCDRIDIKNCQPLLLST
jgi:hypothetical protein